MTDSPPRSTQALLSRTPSFWQVQLAGWAGFALVTLPMKQLVYASLPASLLITAYQLPLSLVLSGLLRLCYRRTQPMARSLWAAAGLVLGACATASLIDLLVSLPVNQLIGVTGPAGLTEPGLYIFRATVYVGWSLLYLLVKSLLAARQQAFRTAVADEKLRLEALRYQLSPGFLANSLTLIADTIDEDPAVARAMTVRLSGFYRTALRHTERDGGTRLGEEMDLLRAYLEIERLRPGGALRVHYEVDDRLLALPLPPLLLLPLAEQAVQYGRGSSAADFEIRVTAQRVDRETILLEVARTGQLQAPPANPPGSDLLNLHARLERYYPGRHRLTLTQDSARARATLWLPLAG